MSNGPKNFGSEDHTSLLSEALASVGVALRADQIQQLARHFALLQTWNEKINLTAIRAPEKIAKRHFAESLFLTKLQPAPTGVMVDVGSGAGFPGLPLKVAWPHVEAILLEPNQKKAAFLKEAVRVCRISGIEVRAERLEGAKENLAGRVSLLTMRAVSVSPDVLADARILLSPDGHIALFLGEEDAARLRSEAAFHWAAPVAVPHSERRVILVGTVTKRA
jgi:16S rRNA (guanine527-N7)-methyltransferase